MKDFARFWLKISRYMIQGHEPFVFRLFGVWKLSTASSRAPSTARVFVWHVFIWWCLSAKHLRQPIHGSSNSGQKISVFAWNLPVSFVYRLSRVSISPSTTRESYSIGAFKTTWTASNTRPKTSAPSLWMRWVQLDDLAFCNLTADTVSNNQADRVEQQQQRRTFNLVPQEPMLFEQLFPLADGGLWF